MPRAIDVLRERRLIGSADHEAARRFAELRPADRLYPDAIKALEARGAHVRNAVLAVVMHGQLPNYASRAGSRWAGRQRDQDALEEGLEVLVKFFRITTIRYTGPVKVGATSAGQNETP